MTVTLAVPKRVGRKTVWIRATVSDYWNEVQCDDREITARLLEVRPDRGPGYLPPPVLAWARAAERVLSARVESIEEPSGEAPPGVVMGPIFES
jgi:hypothetical protein